MNKIKYGVIIATHMPPLTFFDTLKRLSSNLNIHIYVIDSSPEVTSTKMQNYIYRSIDNNLNHHFSKGHPRPLIKYFKVPNYGIGHKFNFGIKQAIKDSCDLMTIFTDDVKLLDNRFPIEEIYRFFCNNCDPHKDVLILPYYRAQLQKEIKKAGDLGMTFAEELFQKVRFREELILDGTDFCFCNRAIMNGGKFIAYPKILIGTLPIGREAKFPMWRLYLIARNVISIDLESNGKLRALLTHAFPTLLMLGPRYLYEASLSRALSAQDILDVLEAIFLGFNDGIHKKLGVTSNLQKLSGNRFSNRKL
jgi:GT2 family glycosyltransferase